MKMISLRRLLLIVLVLFAVFVVLYKNHLSKSATQQNPIKQVVYNPPKGAQSKPVLQKVIPAKPWSEVSLLEDEETQSVHTPFDTDGGYPLFFWVDMIDGESKGPYTQNGVALVPEGNELLKLTEFKFVRIYPELLPVYVIINVHGLESRYNTSAYYLYYNLPPLFTFKLYQQERNDSMIFKRVKDDSSIVKTQYVKTFFNRKIESLWDEYDITKVDLTGKGGIFQIHYRLWMDTKRIDSDKIYLLDAELDVTGLKIPELTSLMAKRRGHGCFFMLKDAQGEFEHYDVIYKKYRMHFYALEHGDAMRTISIMQIKYPTCEFPCTILMNYYSNKGNWPEALKYAELLLRIYKDPQRKEEEKKHHAYWDVWERWRADMKESKGRLTPEGITEDSWKEMVEGLIKAYKDYIKQGLTKEELDKKLRRIDTLEEWDQYLLERQQEQEELKKKREEEEKSAGGD